MEQDTINKLLENINLLIERNNIINQQVTRILFLCLNNQEVNNKNIPLSMIENINNNLSRGITHITDNLKDVQKYLLERITEVNNTLVDDIDGLMPTLLEISANISNNSGKLNYLKEEILEIKKASEIIKHDLILIKDKLGIKRNIN